VIRWEVPGPYEVAFSTRQGGVSEGPYASLNLGIFTGDEPERVVENRRRLCAAAGVDPERATMAWQQHGAEVRKAHPESIVNPGLRHDPCDALWSDEPGQAMLLLTADCLPIALARLDGERPAVAVLHAGWRGLLAGIVPAGVAALGARLVTAAIGPAIGPCCYEVGEDVAGPMRAAFGTGLVREGRLDLWSAAERALLAAGVARVERFDLCTACDEERFFSHRRDCGLTGRQGVLARVA
jgi:polyphenol oxidase